MAEVQDEGALLVARIARGDKAAFTAIYDRYLPLVLRWSLRETGNREIAADLAAETFAAALIASPRYRPGKGVTLISGETVEVWADGYQEVDRTYIFGVLADVDEEQRGISW
jgi:Sigma-70 region 2